MYVQYADAKKTRIIAIFAGPQDPASFPHQGIAEKGDPRYLSFLKAFADAREVSSEVEPVLDDAVERAWRNDEITRVTWIRDRHRDELELGRPTSITPDQYAQALKYVQHLRDWPQSEQFPDIEMRPLAPEWVASQNP